MSTGAFRKYYETHHRVIGEKYLSGYASRYMRRYLEPMAGADGKLHEPEFDVLLEIWFPDQATLQACAARLGEPSAAEEIAQDEEKLFDRSRKRSYIVEEIESPMSACE